MTRSLSRQSFVAGISAGAVLSPLAVEAQQAGKVYRIGFLRQGYIDGQNVVVALLLRTDQVIDQ